MSPMVQLKTKFKFKVKIEAIICLNPTKVTKRSVLSQIAGIVDSTGFASASLIRADWISRTMAAGIWMGWRPSVGSSTVMVHRQGNKRFQRNLSPQHPVESAQTTLCIFADALPLHWQCYSMDTQQSKTPQIIRLQQNRRNWEQKRPSTVEAYSKRTQCSRWCFTWHNSIRIIRQMA